GGGGGGEETGPFGANHADGGRDLPAGGEGNSSRWSQRYPHPVPAGRRRRRPTAGVTCGESCSAGLGSLLVRRRDGVRARRARRGRSAASRRTRPAGRPVSRNDGLRSFRPLRPPKALGG